MKWIIGVLLVIIGVLGFFQFKGCGNRVADNLQKNQDSINLRNKLLNNQIHVILWGDSLLRMKYRDDTTRFARTIDSLTKLSTGAKKKITDLQNQLNATINDLIAAVNGSDTSMQLTIIQDLKEKLNDLSNTISFSNQVGESKDSEFRSELLYRDSVVTAKNNTIDSLMIKMIAKETIINQLNAQLDVAIAQIRKGKKVPWITTIAGIIAGLFLGSHIK